MTIPSEPLPLQELYTAGLRQALRESRLFAAALEPEVLRALEEEVEPVSVRSGEVVVRAGDASDSLFLVISGRLRVVQVDDAGAESTLTEIARGETVGEMGLVTGEPRAATVYAIRDSLLGRLSEASYHRLLERYPRAMTARFAGSIMRSLTRQLNGTDRPAEFAGSIALVPAEPGLPLDGFAERLARHLGAHGPTLRLSSESMDAALQRPGAAQALSGSDADTHPVLWLGEQELRHRFVLFQADPLPSAWSARCIRQADRIVVVGRAGADPEPGSLERSLLGGSPRQPVSLVLLHDGSDPPHGTDAWLRPRTVSDHHHLRTGGDADFLRLARLLAGAGVGVVLAGGGARAFAEIGVVRALAEAGVPMDAVAGVSAGSLLAGLLAMGHDFQSMMAEFRHVSRRIDYTLPLHALTSGRTWSALLKRLFGDLRIEDLPLGFFCTSVNLTQPRLIVHGSGSLMHAVRASTALPGILPPVWHEGDLLVDGGMVNNLPVDLMRARPGIGKVVGIEIGSGGKRREIKPFGYHVSGWRSLWNRVTGLGSRTHAPAMMELLMRSMLVGDSLTARTRRNTADRLFRPPTREFSLMDWSRAEQIAEAGYQYACEALAAEPPRELLADPAAR